MSNRRKEEHEKKPSRRNFWKTVTDGEPWLLGDPSGSDDYSAVM
jgi:hypothetical protein